MKRYLLLMIGAGLLALAGIANAKAGALVAPIYPGAVPDPNAGDVTVRVYLSHDPPAKVIAWYKAKLGAKDKSDGNLLWNNDNVENNAGRPLGETDPKVDIERLGRVVMTQSEVVRSLKDMTRTKAIGVLCEGMNVKPEGDKGDNGKDSADTTSADPAMQRLAKLQQQLLQAGQQMNMLLTPADRTTAQMDELFDVLKDEALSGRFGHTKKQLLEVYAKYKHLERDWYPAVKTDNSVTSYDRLQIAGERQASAKGAQEARGNMEALAARIQAALAAGRMDEVQALSAQMQKGASQQGGSLPQNQDQWDHWLGVLKKLDAHAYSTRISINTQPKSWGY